MGAAFALSQLAALPDALIALWLKFLGDGVLQGDRRLVVLSALGLGLSATATWFLTTLSTRVQRRFRDKVTIALEAHVARLQAQIATVAHQERPELPRPPLRPARPGVRARPHVHVGLHHLRLDPAPRRRDRAARVDPSRARAPRGLRAAHRPHLDVAAGGRARRARSGARPPQRLARHLFFDGHDRCPRQGGARHPHRVAALPGAAGGVGALVRAGGGGAPRERCLARARLGRLRAAPTSGRSCSCPPGCTLRRGTCCSCSPRAGGCRPTSGRRWERSASCAGIWLDGSRRLAWLEDYAASLVASADQPAPARLREGLRLEGVSFAYPGTDRLVLDSVDLDLPAGAVVALVGENGAGKSTLVKLLCKLYEPTAGRILVDGVRPLPHARRRVALTPGRGLPGLLPLRAPRPPLGGPRRPAETATRSGRSPPPSAAPGPTTSWRACPPVSRPSSGQPGPGASRSRSGSGRSSRWRGGSCATSRSCSCSTSPRPRSTRRPSTLSSSATPPRRAAGRSPVAAEPAASRSSCPTDSARCAWPTSSSCSTAPG